MSQSDVFLDMFFDEEFVPQAYLDILLSPESGDLNDLQIISSSLISKFDFNMGHLTKELNSTLQTLQKSTERLSMSSETYEDITTTKLDFYLDTLGNSVKALERDIRGIDTHFENLDLQHSEAAQTQNDLRDLEKIKLRLLEALRWFEQIRSIASIALEGIDRQEDFQNIPLASFKEALAILERTVIENLEKVAKARQEESVQVTEEELLQKIADLKELKSAFLGLPKFLAAYGEFIDRIGCTVDTFAGTEDIDLDAPI
ncbi:LAMI_0D06062g1_1 [Lachancea mirantina]|uniref:LAMI_0D06062g1_1 n=1 Tax=Lachancea mirantina TaxID=1230905 RepID=A0A1G4JBJ3_9SACH|nr:LAMI_0D06062g1_1 [Lachancea mirantina]